MINEIEAGQLCDSTFSAIHHGTGTLSSVPGLIERIIREKAWERRKVKMHGLVELPSLRELITRKPMIGWGEDPAKIEALLKDDASVLALWREAMTNEKHIHRPDGDNVTIKPERGNTRSYTVSRLQNDAMRRGGMLLREVERYPGKRTDRTSLPEETRLFTDYLATSVVAGAGSPQGRGGWKDGWKSRYL